MAVWSKDAVKLYFDWMAASAMITMLFFVDYFEVSPHISVLLSLPLIVSLCCFLWVPLPLPSCHVAAKLIHVTRGLLAFQR